MHQRSMQILIASLYQLHRFSWSWTRWILSLVAPFGCVILNGMTNKVCFPTYQLGSMELFC